MVLWNIVGQGIRYGVKGTAAFLNSETGKKTSEATGKAFRAAKEAAKDFASEIKTQNPATKGATPSSTQDYVLDDLQIPWQVMQQLGYERVPGLGPVLLGRELLIQGLQLLQSDDGPRKASIAISAACVSFMSGIARPRSFEYPIDGVEFGRLDAIMWNGIASAILVPVNGRVVSNGMPNRPAILQSTSDPMGLEIAADRFAQIGDFIKAGRSMEELAEIIRLEKGPTTANSYFDRAIQYFKLGNLHDRAKNAEKRKNTKARFRSPFFHNEMPKNSASTIAGSIEYLNLQTALRSN